RVERQDDPQHPHHSLFDVRLEADHARKADPLLPYLAQRTTQRRAMKPTPIGPEARTELESAAGDCDVRWHSTFGSRWDIAWLLFRSAHIRLTIPEGYQTHRDAIEWRARFSIDRMPDQAVGLNPLTTRL